MRTPVLMLLGMLLLVSAASAMAASERSSSAPESSVSAVVPSSRQFDFKSAINGRTYRVQVAIPFVPAPQNGYAVLYVLDGDGYFGTYSFAARIRAMLGEVQPAVVVGIGYPEAESDMKVALVRRQYDLTPTQSDPQQAAQAGLATDLGGADAFLQVVEREVKPRVAAMLPVDSSRDILFGHSLGGLFALHVLFTHPESFKTYLVLSPSIWFNNRVVLDNEAAFAASVKSGKISPRVFVAVGGEEETLPPVTPPGMTREQVEKSIVEAAMVHNARDLGERLKALPGAAGYTARAQVFEGETHISVAWASVIPFLNFALAAHK
ncbi:MAG TPA: alpha/beta hydrolase-fold protein [Steroidobacteraceae bacterium]|nr:alpha/beta hydrolase-fold protein [Steroidobacteraceae bacterium]